MSIPGSRASGLLLHPTSLPGAHGSGDLGLEARRFVDFLADAGQTYWQMLPVGPPGFGNSPYSAASAFAGSPWLLSLEGLGELGFLDPRELAAETLPPGRVDWGRTIAHRDGWLARAAASFAAAPARSREPALAFRDREKHWLDDYALYTAIKRARGGGPWIDWPDELRKRKSDVLDRVRRDLASGIERAIFEQWAFDVQWRSLRAHCHEKGIRLLGDVPIFVAHDSADVWQHQRLFRLDKEGRPSVVAGVPPDYFSATGQRWGNPLYRWKRMREGGFTWWVERFRSTLTRFDAIRLDHFIGFYRYSESPASDPTAIVGRWVKGPREALFDAAETALGPLPIVAEDLGLVTAGVRRLRRRYRFPGLKILQFAFGTDPQAPSFLPHAHDRNAVVYSGTHDNDTIVGWAEDPGGPSRSPAEVESERARALEYLASDGEEIHWDFVRAGLASVAKLAIFPVQDVLGLGSEARMNLPGTSQGNWEFRLAGGELSPEVANRLLESTRVYGRLPVRSPRNP
jgi:4-alpha-glucanotransferase